MDIEKKNIEQLFKDCHQRMLTIAVQMLKDDEEARDAVNDVFAKLADLLMAHWCCQKRIQNAI